MIVSDLDGTLLDSRGGISERTRAAVRAAHRAGHVFVLASARPVRDVRPIAEALGHRAIAVCSNGAVSYDYARDTVVDHHPMEQADAMGVITALRRRFPGVRLGCERWPDLLLEDGFALDPALSPEARRVRALEEEIDGRGLGKLIVQTEGSAHDYYRVAADALPPGLATVTVSTPAFCEITRRGVTKAMALDLLAGRLSIPVERVVAFGDMPNDLPMLRWAGRSVAMANAHPDVLAAADETTLSNDEDGVAHRLEALLAEASDCAPGSPAPLPPPSPRTTAHRTAQRDKEHPWT
ncbi:HAD family hydrolase [Streptomyces clavuligerus]|nr:haloacid dehalogenase [Streptomyces clavuligerus]AXU14773.1 HAD family hydrolase [Streptomyces clavuligerus]EDY50225.1 HAD-superfamily hydrolase [Streptomyces clavuligerus]MBY6304801.1 HAD family hydrolase [Streptomyces clavuligerus]QCS07543.1 HAD family hydrolase [Streptomyces clavuligerus]